LLILLFFPKCPYREVSPYRLPDNTGIPNHKRNQKRDLCQITSEISVLVGALDSAYKKAVTIRMPPVSVMMMGKLSGMAAVERCLKMTLCCRIMQRKIFPPHGG